MKNLRKKNKKNEKFKEENKKNEKFKEENTKKKWKTFIEKEAKSDVFLWWFSYISSKNNFFSCRPMLLLECQ